VLGQRLGDSLPAELEADEELGGNDGDEDPTLAAQLVTIGVVQQLLRSILSLFFYNI
jgi:hypothetical protein